MRLPQQQSSSSFPNLNGVGQCPLANSQYSNDAVGDREKPAQEGKPSDLLSYVNHCKVAVVQSLSRVQLCNPVDCSTSGFPVHHQLPKLTQTHIHRVSDAIQPSHPLLSPSPPAFNLSQHPRIFSNESVLHIRWPKYWSFSFTISPSKEYSGLISFRIDWFDLLAVQQTLKSLLQHHSSKASILWHSAFFTVHPHIHILPLGKP